MKILHLLGLLIVSHFSSGQEQVELFGRVIADEGSPLPGVSFVIRGTDIGVVTNPCGEFKVLVPKNRECTLALSAISAPVYFNLKNLKSKDLSKEIRFWLLTAKERVLVYRQSAIRPDQ